MEAVYAAAKRSRPVPPHAGAAVRKCGQCGKREAMGGDDPVAWRQFQERLAALPEVRRGLRFDAAEYLCPVCALRRFAGYLEEEPFPSTSAIAASEWLWRVESIADLRAILRALAGAAGDAGARRRAAAAARPRRRHPPPQPAAPGRHPARDPTRVPRRPDVRRRRHGQEAPPGPGRAATPGGRLPAPARRTVRPRGAAGGRATGRCAAGGWAAARPPVLPGRRRGALPVPRRGGAGVGENDPRGLGRNGGSGGPGAAGALLRHGPLRPRAPALRRRRDRPPVARARQAGARQARARRRRANRLGQRLDGGRAPGRGLGAARGGRRAAPRGRARQGVAARRGAVPPRAPGRGLRRRRRNARRDPRGGPAPDPAAVRGQGSRRGLAAPQRRRLVARAADEEEIASVGDHLHLVAFLAREAGPASASHPEAS